MHCHGDQAVKLQPTALKISTDNVSNFLFVFYTKVMAVYIRKVWPDLA